MMLSKTIAILDSSAWLWRVGVASALFLGSVSGATAQDWQSPYAKLQDATPPKVQLIRRLQKRHHLQLRRITCNSENPV